MIAAHGDDAPPSRQRVGPRLDLGHGLLDIEGGARNVAGINHLAAFEGKRVEVGVIRPEQPRRLAHRPGTEARAGPIGGPPVEGDTHDREVPRVHPIDSREPSERRNTLKARTLGGVGGTNGTVIAAHCTHLVAIASPPAVYAMPGDRRRFADNCRLVRQFWAADGSCFHH